MKKIAIVLSKIGPKKQGFLEYLTKNFSGVAQIVPVRMNEVSIFVGQGKVEIKHFGENLEKFDLVYFRRIGNRNLSIANVICDYLVKRKREFIDKALQIEGRGEDKLSNNYFLSLDKVPVVPMVSSSDWTEIVSFVGLPMIAKDIDKQRTEGIFMIKTKEDFNKLTSDFPESRFVFEKFMNIEKEYRLLVMGTKVRTVLTKDKRTYGFKVSTPIGIPEEYVDPNFIPDNLKKIAVKSAQVLSLQVAGVDLMIEKNTGKPFIIEVNRGPGITNEVDISPELPELAKYLKEKLANSKSN